MESLSLSTTPDATAPEIDVAVVNAEVSPAVNTQTSEPSRVKLDVVQRREIQRAKLDRYATEERRGKVSSFLAKSLANTWSWYQYESPRHETAHVIKSPARAIGRFALKGVGVAQAKVEKALGSTEFGQNRKRKKHAKVLSELQRSLNSTMPDTYINKLLYDLNSLSSDVEYSLVRDGDKKKLSARHRS